MQNPRCILKFYSMRLYLYKQPHLMRTWRLTSSSILFRYVVWSHYWRHSSTAMEGSKGCIVDSGTPLPSNLPHHDLALHSWSAKADCFEDFLARDEGEGHYACNKNGPVHLHHSLRHSCGAGCRSHTTDDQRTAHQATKGGCLYKHRRIKWILRMHLGFCI